jgi:hypothetical protein
MSEFAFSSMYQAAELEIEAYPLLDELTSKISTLNLERVRRLKSRLVALTRRVQKVNCILVIGSLLLFFLPDHLSKY